MTNNETKRLLNQVEEQTGYRVTIGTTDKAIGDAEMITAANGHPVHLINVSDRKLSFSDYIIAVQCSMILTMWSHPDGVPQFRTFPEKINNAAREAANFSGLSIISKSQALQMVTSMFNGLMHQLLSTPSELIALEYCYNECPSLRQMQAEAVNANLRRNTESLKPEIKTITPPDIYEKNQIMCAALARFWCGVTNSMLPSIPYQSIGVDYRGNLLLQKFLKAEGSLGERSVSVVDAWAMDLELHDYYEWKFRDK